MPQSPAPLRPQPCIGVSRCLLGEAVRYDGGHKRQAWLVERLAAWTELVPVCPEVAIGLGVPRPRLQLVQETDGIHVRGVADPAQDVTDRLARHARQHRKEQPALDGWIFKSRSPSCGVSGVPVFDPAGNPVAPGRGVFAAVVMAELPLLPVAEEQELDTGSGRDRFLERLFVYRHYRRWFARGVTRERLENFHHALRGHLLARGEAVRVRLERVAERAGQADEIAPAYLQQVMTVLGDPVRREGLARALQALAREGGADEAMSGVIREYRAGIVDLQTVVRRWRNLPEREPCFLLAPEPAELALRYGVVAGD